MTDMPGATASEARVERMDGGIRVVGLVTFENAVDLGAAGDALLRSASAAGGGQSASKTARVDLSGVLAPGCVAVAVLLAWYRACHELDQQMVLENAPSALRRILDFTGLDEVLMADQSTAAAPMGSN